VLRAPTSVASRRRWAFGGRKLHTISTRSRVMMNALYLCECAVMRYFWSGKVTYIWWNAPHAARITGNGETRKKYDSATTQQRRLLGDERSGSGWRTHTQRNDRSPQTKRNYCRGTADPRSDVAGDDPHWTPTTAPTTATPPRTQLDYRTINTATVSAETFGIYYLPCGPVIIVRESPPTSATERCRPRGCYRVWSKNIVQRARRNSRAAMPGINKYQPYNI